MTRNGVPISQVQVRTAVDANIDFGMSFAEWEAACAAGLNLWDWENNKYPVPFKAKVIAWHKLHRLIEIHQEDAVSKKMEAESKKH